MNYLSFFFYIIAYFLGSIPFGLILTKYMLGFDVRKVGSGNIGATNVYRNGNKFIAILTLILDGFKGFIAVYIAKKMNLSATEVAICGLLSVIGHMFPIWLKFKGGKGVATMITIVLTLTPYTALIVMLIWFITFLYKRISSLASIIATVFLPLIAAILEYSFYTSAIYIIGSMLILLKHKDNIKRLCDGKENKI